MSIVNEIDKRYSELASSQCCLSCGGAVDLAKPVSGEICVDLGSGRGTDVIRMAESVGERGFVFGIDASAGMIAKAQATALKFKVENVRFILSELEKLPIEDSIVDLVVSNCTLNHSGDKQSVWNEIYRILKPGGRFVISDIYSIEEVPEDFRNDPVAVAECWAGAIVKSEYLSQISNSGFNEISILEESVPYEKGKIKVCSFTVSGKKSKGCCC